jgi:hypothetical protein
VQAIVFAGMIGTLFADAGRSRDLGRSFITQGARNCDANCRTGYAASSYDDARRKQSEAGMLMVVAGICSIVTLTLGFVGIRRRKVAPAPQTT